MSSEASVKSSEKSKSCADKFVKRIAAGFFDAAVISVVVLLAVVLTNVILRKVFNKPIGFGEELASIFMYILVFGALGELFNRGAHLRIESFKKTSHPLSRRALTVEIAVSSISLIFIAIWIWYCVKMLIETFSFKVKFLTMPGLPVWPVFLIIVLGLGMLGICMFVSIRDLLRKE